MLQWFNGNEIQIENKMQLWKKVTTINTNMISYDSLQVCSASANILHKRYVEPKRVVLLDGYCAGTKDYLL
jgi:hypothetical protein